METEDRTFEEDLSNCGYDSNESNVSKRKTIAEKSAPKHRRALPQLKVVQTGQIRDTETRYISPHIVYSAMKSLNKLDREHFIVLHLNAAYMLIAKEVISIGDATRSIVHPREVFKGAVLNGSIAIICVHNHPSGSAEPSSNDLQITEQLKEASKIMEIPIVDHVIIGNNQYYSMHDNSMTNLRPKKKKY